MMKWKMKMYKHGYTGHSNIAILHNLQFSASLP